MLKGVRASRNRQNGRFGLLRHILPHRAAHTCRFVYMSMATAMGGCSFGEAPVPTGQGKIRLTIGVDAQMRSADGSAFTPVQPIDLSRLSMSMTTADGAYSHTWQSIDQFDATQSFPAGTYKVSAYYDATDDNEPSYYVSAEFDVLSDQTTDVTLDATIKAEEKSIPIPKVRILLLFIFLFLYLFFT